MGLYKGIKEGFVDVNGSGGNGDGFLWTGFAFLVLG